MSIVFAKVPNFNTYVDENGLIWDLTTSKKLPLVTKGNELHVELMLLNTPIMVKVASLMIYTLLLDNRMLELLEKIIPIYKDKNPNNIRLDNLTYRFKIYDEHDLDKFHPIPYHTGYLINRKGVMRRLNDDTRRLGYRDSNGYIQMSLRRDMGYLNKSKSTILGRHRALALTFLEYDIDTTNLDINHIDGIPGNDNLSNLEIVTRSDNLIHAYKNGLRSDNIPVLTRCVFTGEEWESFSIVNAAEVIGLSAGTVAFRLNTPGQKIYTGGFQHKLKSDPTPWRRPGDLKKELEATKLTISVRTYNVFTGKEEEYSSLNKAALVIGVNSASIKWKLDQGDSIRPIRGFVFKDGSDRTPFITPTTFELECFKDSFDSKLPSPVEVIYLETGKKKRFTSLRRTAESLGLSMRTLSSNIRMPSKCFKSKYKIRYLDLWSL